MNIRVSPGVYLTTNKIISRILALTSLISKPVLLQEAVYYERIRTEDYRVQGTAMHTKCYQRVKADRKRRP